MSILTMYCTIFGLPIWDKIKQIIVPDAKEPLKYVPVLIGTLTLLIVVIKELLPLVKAKIQSHMISYRLGRDLYPAMYVERELEYYVTHDCQALDPAGEEEPKHLAPVRQQLFVVLQNVFSDTVKYRYLFLLADSGVGKSCALLNFYVRHVKQWWRREYELALFPVGIPDLDVRLEKIPQEVKHRSILLLDAFDEDPKALSDYQQRIDEILNLTSEFRAVLISCRTQFFTKDDEIPKETGRLKYHPRSAGESAEHYFHKVYLSPFSDSQVEKYLRKRYSILRKFRRGKARKIVKKVPNLTVRPMLLSHIDSVIDRSIDVNTAADIYEVMIEAWLDREKGFVKNKAALKAFSLYLAEDLFVNRATRGAERIPRAEMIDLAHKWDIKLENWQLSSRSLLNRDSEGNIKFAHRSIMEYLFVKRFLSLPLEERKAMPWTDQMKKFLLEIIKQYSESQSIIDLGNESLATKLDLSYADLSECDLSFGNYRGVRFGKVDLSKSNCARGYFAECSFNESNLAKADFSGADLTDTNFSGANLVNAIFSEAILIRANFEGANIEGATLNEAGYVERRAKMTPADIRNDGLAVSFSKNKIEILTPKRGIIISEPFFDKYSDNPIPRYLSQSDIFSNYEIAENIFRHFIPRALGNKAWLVSRIAVLIPSSLTIVERASLINSIRSAAAHKIYLVEEAAAAAVGAGLPIDRPYGNMLVHVSKNTTEIAVFFDRNVIYSKSVAVAENAWDEAIAQYVKHQLSLAIGNVKANQIRLEIGSADSLDIEKTLALSSLNSSTGIPQTISLTDEHIREALSAPLLKIIEAIHDALLNIPRSVAKNIYDRGLTLAGSGTSLEKLDTRIGREIGLKVWIADEPLSVALVGLGDLLSMPDLLKSLCWDIEKQRYTEAIEGDQVM